MPLWRKATVLALHSSTAGVLLLAGCSIPTQPQSPLFEYLGDAVIPHEFQIDGTVVGGLSGITYDPGRQVYYVISDDRSENSPARFYSARISFAQDRLAGLEVFDTTTLLDPNSRPFGSLLPDADPPVIPPDPEGIAFDERRQQLYWTSEGARELEDPDRPLLLDPWVRSAEVNGGFRGRISLPPMFAMSALETGPRQNLSLEGVTLTPSGRHLYAAMEGPLLTDGPPPTEQEGALTRIIRLDPEAGTATGQFAYPLDPVSAGSGGDTGLSDLVALDDETFLVVERSYSEHNVIRIYRASVTSADNVLIRESLDGIPPQAMAKELIAELSSGSEVNHADNIEGITLGPRLSDGRQTVVLVSDDNFRAEQVTQLIAFAYGAGPSGGHVREHRRTAEP
ncbi:esterase-like activity of phytase family protein [Mycolicibacterium mengxianglii]|uniref:esterase-like activity of phytase family protein n=1 Tax=Mycolicibacterium mengxianglii TaxID=2736649 RepID=UPI0018EF2E86|nr:esterase-like activity of phytase family protein [Mycolicibacterium mengxianglii]